MDILPQLIANSLIAGAIYSLVALGFNLIFSTVKFFDLGYGALTAIGGYAVFYFAQMLGMPVLVSVVLGIIVAGVAGFFIEKLVYYPLRISTKVFDAGEAVVAVAVGFAVNWLYHRFAVGLLGLNWGPEIGTVLGVVAALLVAYVLYRRVRSGERTPDVGHAVIGATAGFAVAWLYERLVITLLALEGTLWIGQIFGVILGLVAAYIAYQRLDISTQRKPASRMVLIVASLGVFTAIQSLLAIGFTSQFQTLSGGGGQTVYTVLGASITQVQVIILILAAVIAGGLALLMRKTMFGKAVNAISDDEEVAKVVGINTNKIIGYVFFLGGAIAGLAGIMQGFDTGIEPTMGLTLLLKGVIASIIGGIGNVFGGVAGAFLLGFVENFGIWKISGEWKDAIAFALLIIFLLFRPKGIFPR